MKQIIGAVLGFVFISNLMMAQGVGIGTNAPESSAILELKATNKVFLPPRMTAAEKILIPLPMPGLMIYQTDGTKGMYVYDGNGWLAVTGTPTGNGWSLTGNSGIAAATHFVGTSDNQPLNFRVNNIAAGHLNPVTGNAAFGIKALASNTTGYDNVAIGAGALEKSTTGHGMVAVGDSALFNQVDNGASAYYNTAVGSKALFANATGYANTALGTEALTSNNSSFNTAVGMYALTSNTFGSNNVSVGTLSMENNVSGDNNTAVGTSALHNNNKYNNTAVGFQCLLLNDANENTATGYTALRNNTTGTKNSAFGLSALLANNTGSYNTAVGYSASWKSKGNWNTALGVNAMYNTTSGQANVAVGYQAMLYNITGDNNTVIGTNAGPAVAGTDYSNSTAIGQTAIITASNQVRIGNSAITSIGGYADWTKISDIRFKKNVRPETHGLDFIMKLEPIVYNLDLKKLNYFLKSIKDDSLDVLQQNAITSKENILYSGFSAQQVELAAKSIQYDFSGIQKPQHAEDHYSLAYAEFVVPLVKSVQEQQQLITALQTENATQEKQIADLQKQLDKLIERMDAMEKK